MTLDPTGRLFVERLTVKAWGGEDTISISGDGIAPNGDSVSNMTLNLGAGINAVSLNSLQSFGPLKMTAGDGNDSLEMNNVELHVKNSDKLAPMTVQAGRGSLSVTLTDSKTGAVTVAASEVDLDAFGSNSVNGNMSVLGTRSATFRNLGTMTIDRGLIVKSTAGDVHVVGGGVGMTIGGNLTISAAHLVDAEFVTDGPSEVKGNMTVTGGPADDFIFTNDQLKVAKNLSINLGGGSDEVRLDGPVAKNLSINLGGGSDTVNLGDPETTLSVGGNLSIATGSGSDRIELDRVLVSGRTSLLTGVGPDVVDIWSGSTFTGPTDINMALATTGCSSPGTKGVGRCR